MPAGVGGRRLPGAGPNGSAGGGPVPSTGGGQEGGQNAEVTLTPAGEVVEVEKEIAAGDLPGAVARTLGQKYPRAAFEKVEEVREGDRVRYEVLLVTAAKQRVEVKLDPKGQVIG